MDVNSDESKLINKGGGGREEEGEWVSERQTDKERKTDCRMADEQKPGRQRWQTYTYTSRT